MYKQVPLSEIDQQAFARYLAAMADGRDELPDNFGALNKLLDEARRQARLFYLTFGTWDFGLEAEVHHLLAEKDRTVESKLPGYR